MYKKKIFWLPACIAILFISGAILIGCTPAAEEPAVVEEEPATVEEEPAVEEAAAMPKVVIGVDSGADSEVLRSFPDRIKADLGIEVEIVSYPVDKIYETLMLSLSSGAETFDIVDYNPYMVGDFGPYLEPLENLGSMDDLNIEGIVPAFRDNYSFWEGKRVGVPFDGDLRIFHARKDLFEDPQEQANFKAAYGYDLGIPKTYKEYLDIAEFFTRPDENLYGTGECTLYFLVPYWFDRYIEQTYESSGGKIYGQLFDENMVPLINSPEGIAALNNFIETLQYMPPELAKEFEWAEVRNQFYAGRLAMAPQWTDLSKTGSDPEVSQVVGEFLLVQCLQAM